MFYKTNIDVSNFVTISRLYKIIKINENALLYRIIYYALISRYKSNALNLGEMHVILVLLSFEFRF
jgi:hypothetical protein